MEMTVIDIFNATEKIANAIKYPKIRVFAVEHKPSPISVDELLQITQNWSLPSPSPQTLQEFYNQS
jgi:hypothetical protein